MQDNPGSMHKYLGSGWPWPNPASDSAIGSMEDLGYAWQKSHEWTHA